MSPPRLALVTMVLTGLFVAALGFHPSSAHPTDASMPPRLALSNDSLEGPSPPHPLSSSWNRLNFWVGGAALNGSLIGKVPRSSMGLLGIRYHRRLAPSPETRTPGLTYTYTINVMPIVALSVPDGTIPRRSFDSETTVTDGTTTYGLGVAPIGLRLSYRTGTRVQPFIAGSTGVLYFVRAFPDRRGERLNFTVDAGGGLQIGLTPTATLTLGYRYHHLSNGFRGRINPGIDSHLFSVGVTVVP